MDSPTPDVPEEKKRPFLNKALRVFLWIIASLVFLVILVFILIQVPAVQNFARKKAVTYLEKKLNTKVVIGKLDIDFPSSVSLQNIYLEDQSKDTLLSGGEVKVDISMFKLLSGDIDIQEITLNNITAKIKRVPPDSVFNFQFITDAFMGEQQKEVTTQDSSTLQMHIGRILVDSTRIVYLDPYTGNDMDLAIGHFDTKIETFDPTHLLFNFPSINLKGLKGHFYQMEPLQKTLEKTVAEASAEPDNYLQFINEKMQISDVNVAFNSEPSHLKSSYIIDDLVIHPETFDLKRSIITLKDATLSNSTIRVETDSKAVKIAPKDSVITVTETPPFKIIAGELVIKNSNLKFDDRSAPQIARGMDFLHMDMKEIDLKASGLEYSLDTTLVNIQSASLKEKSGFELLDMTADFEMNPTKVSLENLLIETPSSELKHTAIITYPSLEALQVNPGVLGLDIELSDSKLSMKDLLTFMPALNTQGLPPAGTLYIDAKITGKVNDLNFQQLDLRGLTATNISATGVVRGLPDPNKLYADLNIRRFQSSKRDLFTLIPPGTIPPNITVPETFSASGRIKGGMNNMYTDVAINTSLGGAKIKGNLTNITDQARARYDLAINARNLQLGTLMQNPQLGVLTADVNVKGNGFEPQTANAAFNGVISEVTYNNYTYRNINLDGKIANKLYDLKAEVHDVNVDATIAANGEFATTFPSVHVKATIDSIKTLPLHLTPQSIKYHGRIEGDFSSVDPDNLAGSLFVTHSVLVYEDERVIIDSLQLIADNSAGNKSLTLKSDFLTAGIQGRYTLTQLGDVFQQAIQPYYTMAPQKTVANVAPYDFSINIGAVDNAALHAFLPGLKDLKPVDLAAHFSNDSGWNAFMKAPLIVYETFELKDIEFAAQTANGQLGFKTSLGSLKSGTSLAMFATTINGTVQNNVVDFTLNIKDAKSVDKYNLAGIFRQPALNNYSFSLKPGTLLLNYDDWTISGDNNLQYVNNDITANNFVLSQGAQTFSINSMGTGTNKPLRFDFTNFNIATITGFVQNDSLLVGGLLNGNAIVKNIQIQPNFTTDLTVQDLSVYQDTLGNLTAKVNNNVANQFNADIRLIGRGNALRVSGDYFLKPENKSNFDFVIDIAAFQMKSLEGFTKGGIHDSRGNLYGKISIDGSLEDPNIDGRINFNEIAFTASAVNNVFKIDKESIAIINNEGIQLNTFSIRDTADNAITIDGMLNTKNFYDYTFDLKVKADNFQAINSTSKDNKLFYGKLVFSTNLSITGTPTQPVVEGNFGIDDETDFSVVLPQADPGVVKREGIVEFVDYSAIPEDSLFMRPYDSLNQSSLLGYDISVNITVGRKSTFNLIVDQGNGDFLRLKGDAQLTGGIDPSGKVTLVGSYEIDEGSYDLSFNFIKRKFLIQKGSRIVWTGEPTTAQVDVTAVYIANTQPVDLVQGQTTGDLNLYKQKLPFDVNLNIDGELMQPQITFDIQLPEDKNYGVSSEVTTTVRTALTQLRQEPGEMNKQVFALLLLNRFVGKNPFDNSSGGSLDANTFARQSVSRLLTEQLNQLTEGLIEGVDINFDLATTEDYTTGSKQNRTNFNVGLSKRLLNDRLTVTVGSDFELEGPRATNSQQNNVAGNIAIDYKLSKDGRYMLRAYRKNDYTGALQGYVIETGLGFIISVDFNKFSQIFLSKEQRQKKREIKKINKLDKKTEEEQSISEQDSAVFNAKDN